MNCDRGYCKIYKMDAGRAFGFASEQAQDDFKAFVLSIDFYRLEYQTRKNVMRVCLNEWKKREPDIDAWRAMKKARSTIGAPLVLMDGEACCRAARAWESEKPLAARVRLQSFSPFSLRTFRTPPADEILGPNPEATWRVLLYPRAYELDTALAAPLIHKVCAQADQQTLARLPLPAFTHWPSGVARSLLMQARGEKPDTQEFDMVIERTVAEYAEYYAENPVSESGVSVRDNELYAANIVAAWFAHTEHKCRHFDGAAEALSNTLPRTPYFEPQDFQAVFPELEAHEQAQVLRCMNRGSTREAWEAMRFVAKQKIHDSSALGELLGRATSEYPVPERLTVHISEQHRHEMTSTKLELVRAWSRGAVEGTNSRMQQVAADIVCGAVNGDGVRQRVPPCVVATWLNVPDDYQATRVSEILSRGRVSLYPDLFNNLQPTDTQMATARKAALSLYRDNCEI